MSRGPEDRLWTRLSKVMRGRWDAQRHEDAYQLAIPDVSWAAGHCDGWLELKALERAPARTLNLSRSLTPEQCAWLERRGAFGDGRCFVLAAIGRRHLLVHWTRARELRGPVSIEHVQRLAFHYPGGRLRGWWPRTPPPAELLELLTCPGKMLYRYARRYDPRSGA